MRNKKFTGPAAILVLGLTAGGGGSGGLPPRLN